MHYNNVLAIGSSVFKDQQYPIQFLAGFNPSPPLESGDENNYHQPMETMYEEEVCNKTYRHDTSLTFLLRP